MGRKSLGLSAEEMKKRKLEQIKKYQQTEKGQIKLKEAQKRYEVSEKGIKRRKKNINEK